VNTLEETLVALSVTAVSLSKSVCLKCSLIIIVLREDEVIFVRSEQNFRESTVSKHSHLFYFILKGARGIVVVKALCYTPEGRGFDSR
jgi:hypothetical protein